MTQIYKNKQYTLTITRLDSRANGVSVLLGKKMIVPYALPSEVVEVLVIKVSKTYAICKLIRVVSPSINRVTPACPDFYRCGGCQLQHMNEASQEEFKQTLLDSEFSLFPSLSSIEISPVINSISSFYYRNKAQFAVSIDSKTGDVLIGLYAPHSNRVIDLETCLIQSRSILTVYQCLRNYLKAHPDFVLNTQLKHLFIRCNPSESEVMLAFVCESAVSSSLFSDILNTLSSISFLKSILLNINPYSGNTILGSETVCLNGLPFISEGALQISLQSFLQSHSQMATILYEFICHLPLFSDTTRVWDLYCGSGTLTLKLAAYCKEIIGIDCVSAAISDAEATKLSLNVLNARFICSDVLELSCFTLDIPDVVILDPPRKGCERVVLEFLCKQHIPSLLYVSCHPVSLARDLDFLTQNGYHVEQVTPFDNFPHTFHLETVVHLRYC